MKPSLVTATITKIQDSFALLKDGALELYWPTQYLPEGSIVGSTVVIEARTKERSEGERYAEMRQLLEELIN